MNKKESQKMPYNADMTIFDKILAEMQHTKETGIETEKLWINIGEAKNQNRSYTLNLFRYLGLVETDGGIIKLTKLGRSVTLSSEGKKFLVLAKNMPDRYIAMYKWIRMSKEQEVQSGDLKVKYHEGFGDIHSPLLLERSIATFMKYLSHIGVATHTGKGQGAKIALTLSGKRILEGSEISTEAEITPTTASQPIQEETDDRSQSVNKFHHPITIISPNRPQFFYDVRSKEDWDVIDGVVASMKRDWENKTSTGKAKPEKAEDDKKSVKEPS